jgi:small-conductance mechanosensitive channel
MCVRWLLLAVIAALASSLAVRAAADAAETTVEAGAEVSGEHVPLVFFNRTVFVFRAAADGYSPAQRAKSAHERLRAIVGEPGAGVVSVKVIPAGHVIDVDGSPMFTIRPGDVNPLHGETLETLAARTRQQVEEAVRAYHDAYDPAAWARALLRAGIATGIWLGSLAVLLALSRWTRARIAALVERRVSDMQFAGLTVASVATLRHGALRGVTLLALLVALFVSYLWLTYSLGQFPYTAPWAGQLRGYLLDMLARVVLGMIESVPGLAFVVVIFLITRAVAQMLRVFFQRVEHGRIKLRWVDADTAGPTRRIFVVALWLFALSIAYPYVPGAQTDAFKGLSVLVGLMISLGGASVVGQVLSGVSLIYQRPLKPGEYVRIGEVEGTVMTMGFMRTTIHTGTGEEVSVPNSSIVAAGVRNYSRLVEGKGFVLHTAVTIGYDTPWRQVHAMLLEAARRTAGVVQEPAPYVVQTALSDFYVGYRLVCHASFEQAGRRAQAMSALHANIQDVFNEHGVQIMSPHYLGDPQTAKTVPPERWFLPPAQPPASQAGQRAEGEQAG